MNIWKYPLSLEPMQLVSLPLGSEILTIQLQRGVPTLWVKVDPDKINYSMRIFCEGTDFRFDHYSRYIATVQLDDGTVWHYFVEQDGS